MNPSQPSLKVSLRPLQEEALTAWQENDHQGILAMATGAGKTITALGGAVQLQGVELIIIGVPTNELVQQWADQLDQRTTLPSPMLARGKAELWAEPLFRKLRLLNRGDYKRKPVVVIGNYGELSKPRVGTLIDDAGGLPPRSLLIADEVHTTGARGYQRLLREDFRYRLGLSATPLRAHDEEGTGVVLDYFGGVVYEFSLQQAIKAGILCEYDYFVYITELEETEHQRFQQLTAKLGRLLHSQDEEAKEQAQQVAIQRAKIVKAAGAKLGTLQKIIADFPPQRAMIYCADIDQATAVSGQLARSGVRVARYSSAESNRHHLLQEFTAGRLDGLVAVKCLDEGVDVPAASQAVILASDGSQRQFIQRRGRILRFAPQKSVATLIDVLVVPPLEGEEVQLIESELKRVGHFVQSARNKSHAILTLAEALALYEITYSDFL